MARMEMDYSIKMRIFRLFKLENKSIQFANIL